MRRLCRRLPLLRCLLSPFLEEITDVSFLISAPLSQTDAYSDGYQTPSVAYTMPAAQPYPSLPPQQPFPYNPNAPVSFYGPQQPPPGPSFHHLPAPPRPNPGGPPNKRIRYDQNQPPPALPPLPQSIATPAVPGPSFSNMSQSSPAAVPFNPGPPPPHLSHPPHSGKAPLPPQNQIRPNNPANRQSKKAKDNNVPPPASSNVPPLPSNPKLPPKPTTGPPTNDAPTSKETRKPSTEPPQSGSSNAPLPRRTPHEGRGQHRNRGGGAQRGQRHKGRNANGRQRFSQLQSDPYPSHDRTQQVPKEKDKLTDFRIDALHLEFDGELVWSWKAADTQVEPKAAASEPKNLKETESSTDVGQTSAAAPVDLQSNGATGQTEDEGDEQRISALLVPRPSSTQELKSDNNPPEEETLQRPTSAPETPSGDREIELQTNSKPQTTDSSVRTSSDQPQASFPVPSKHGREEEEATTEVADGSDDKALQGNRNKKMRAESPARRAPDLSLTSTAPPIGRENSRLRIYFATANSQPSSRQKSSSKTKSKSTSLKRKDPPSSAAASPARSLRQSSLDTSTNREGNGAAEEEDLDGEPVQPEAVPTADQSQGEGAHTLPTEGTEAAVALKETKQDKLGSNEEKSKADTTLSEGDSTPTAVVPDEGAPSEPQMEAPSEPAADRVSISYARNQRRLVIDADIVRDLTIKRSEGRIECTMPCEDPTSKADQEGVQQERLDHHRTYRGILVSDFKKFRLLKTNLLRRL